MTKDLVQPPPRRSVSALLACGHLLADASAAAIRPHFRKLGRIENKGSAGTYDPVTAADIAAEKAILRNLRTQFPEHGLYGEELGHHNPGAALQWVVDPIDGTRAFITGSPLWGTLIGLLDDGTPLLGMMNQPFTGERYWAAQAKTYLSIGGKRANPIATRPCRSIADAVLTTTHPDLFAAGREADGFARLKSLVRMTRFGGDCYAYCLLASGGIDLIVEAGLKPYDIVALIPIIERAGGRITTWEGKAAAAGGRIVAAGDPRLHEAALKVLNA